MSSGNIIDVNEVDFEFEVVAFSQNLPVVVDFWADWCRPCKTLSPMLERLAVEGQGSFRLARVDADNNPNLALRFGVRTLPTVKAFSNGAVVGEFAGAIPEERLREFLGKITPPSPLDLALEKADSLFFLHQYARAEEIYRQISDQVPNHPRALLGLARIHLALNRPSEALNILREFPASHYFKQAEKLMPLAIALLEFRPGGNSEDSELDAAYHSCLRLVSRGNFPAALDGLLDILRQNKRYANGKAQQVFLSLLELLGEDDPQTREYRSELANVLF